MRMSAAEMLKASGSKVTPVARAWFAYEQLHDSDLRFDRTVAFEQRYPSVKWACAVLNREFYDATAP